MSINILAGVPGTSACAASRELMLHNRKKGIVNYRTTGCKVKCSNNPQNAYNVCSTAKGAMETVFDHNPTPEELRYLFLSGQEPEAYRATHHDQESEYGNIYALYMIRGDRNKALEYLERIRDPKGLFGPKNRND